MNPNSYAIYLKNIEDEQSTYLIEWVHFLRNQTLLTYVSFGNSGVMIMKFYLSIIIHCFSLLPLRRLNFWTTQDSEWYTRFPISYLQ